MGEKYECKGCKLNKINTRVDLVRTDINSSVVIINCRCGQVTKVNPYGFIEIDLDFEDFGSNYSDIKKHKRIVA